MKAPHTHSICMTGTQGSHFSVMLITISSCETMASPSIAGKLTKAVKRISLRNMFCKRCVSSEASLNTGCPTLFIIPKMVEYPIVVHLLPCE